MFENLFVHPQTIKRYRSAPLLEERLSYLRHYAETGARWDTLRSIAGDQITLLGLLNLRQGDRVTAAQIKDAVDQSGLVPVRRQSLSGRAIRWLGFAGMLAEEAGGAPRHAHTVEVANFEAWMRNKRNFTFQNRLQSLTP